MYWVNYKIWKWGKFSKKKLHRNQIILKPLKKSFILSEPHKMSTLCPISWNGPNLPYLVFLKAIGALKCLFSLGWTLAVPQHTFILNFINKFRLVPFKRKVNWVSNDIKWSRMANLGHFWEWRRPKMIFLQCQDLTLPQHTLVLTFMGEFHFDPCQNMVNWARIAKMGHFGSFWRL